MLQSADEQEICVYRIENSYQVLVAKPSLVMNSIQIPAYFALEAGKRNSIGQKKEAFMTYCVVPCIRCVHTLSITSLTTP